MSGSVSVPAELVEALRQTVRVWDASEVAIAARALVDAVERPSEDECPECKHPKTDHHWVKGGDRWACRGDCLCDIGFDRPAPAAPPSASEPLCRCGHAKKRHRERWGDCRDCDCDEYEWPSSISDEAEAVKLTDEERELGHRRHRNDRDGNEVAFCYWYREDMVERIVTARLRDELTAAAKDVDLSESYDADPRGHVSQECGHAETAVHQWLTARAARLDRATKEKA